MKNAHAEGTTTTTVRRSEPARTKVAEGAYKMDEDSFSFGPEWQIYPHPAGAFVRRTRGRR